MTKIAYLECPTGIAGDMCLGALVDAGVPLSYLTEQLAKLKIAAEYNLWVEDVRRSGQRATKLHVEMLTSDGLIEELSQDEALEAPAGHSHNIHAAEHSNHKHSHAHSHSHSHSHNHSHPTPAFEASKGNHGHGHGATRCLPEIEQLIQTADLPERVEAWSLAIFRNLAEAEGFVHGIAPEQVHFHEVGATDAIVDIVGTCLGFDWLGVETIYCSALPTGGGTIWAAHGQLPVPTPATLKLFQMRQVPIYSNGIQKELVTPTGAAIATTLATHFGNPPAMVLHQIGLGAGNKDLPIPNILRLWLGEATEGQRAIARSTGASQGRSHPSANHSVQAVAHKPATEALDPTQQTIALLETQIDDLNPQAIGYLYDRLFAVGALDVFTQAIGMKKSRPGLLLSVVCKPDAVTACETVLFKETTTIGIRRSLQQRTALVREMQTAQTPYGDVRIKVARRNPEDPQPTNVQAEYEDCAAIAREQNLPWREVHRIALQSWHLSQTTN